MKFKPRFFRVKNDLQIAADEGGDPAAPTVLLTHGGGQTRHSWKKAGQELVAGGYHVVNLDARGHGESGWPSDGDYALESMSSDIQEVIDQLDCEPALVGASMGGMAALYLAGTATACALRALVLVDVVPRVEPAGASKIGDFMLAYPDGFANLDEAADAVAAYNPGRQRSSDTAGLIKNLRRGEDGRWRWHWDPLFVQNNNFLDPRVTEAMLAAARNVQIPTLLVRGMQSDVVGDTGVDELRQSLPMLETFDVPSAGHMVAGDKNDAFNQAVISFLYRHMPLTAA